MGWTNDITLIVAGSCSILFFLQSYKLFLSLTIADAKKLMFASFIWLPIIQFLYVFDKNLPAIMEALWKHGTLF